MSAASRTRGQQRGRERWVQRTTTQMERKKLTNVEEDGKGLTNDGRTYAEVVREGPEKSDWKFVPAAPADVVELP